MPSSKVLQIRSHRIRNPRWSRRFLRASVCLDARPHKAPTG